ATNQAGVAIIGDRGTSPGNLLRRIAYLERPIQGSVVGIGRRQPTLGDAALTVTPNPARGAVSFSLASGEGGVIDVFGVTGRRIARLPLVAGAPARWDGRDERGRPVPDGLYLARLAGRDGTSTKFLMMR